MTKESKIVAIHQHNSEDLSYIDRIQSKEELQKIFHQAVKNQQKIFVKEPSLSERYPYSKQCLVK